VTSIVTQLVALTVQENTYDVLSVSFGMIAILLLIILLVMKEMLRTFGGSRFKTWAEALDVAIAPLLLAFGLIIIMRVIYLVDIPPK